MSSPKEEGQGQLPRQADAQRPVSRPSLLPAFEPSSSSPPLPRPVKRKFDGSPSRNVADLMRYPTPVPTSSTAVLPSSPPAVPSTRPGLQRTLSTASERVPLGALPSVDLPANGEAVLMGRSSNSSHYQLSANRLISRVHVRVSYRAANDGTERPSILVECLGWNGAKIHCRGQVWELGKGDTFQSDKPLAEIMLDVQDARVMLRWPAIHRDGSLSAVSDATLDDDGSPRRALTPAIGRFDSSPPRSHIQLRSPVSPSPRDRLRSNASSTFLGAAPSPNRPSVQVYEDEASEDESGLQSAEQSSANPEPESATSVSKASHASSTLSEPDNFFDQDEENDPIIHSFGVFGDNLLPRMASIHAASPERSRHPLKVTSSQQQRTSSESIRSMNMSPVRNHVINQLAFSRLHSLPLSTIMKNLPDSLKVRKENTTGGSSQPATEGVKTLTDAELKDLLDDTPCVGEISRQGKDAAGKLLEDEFYYLPEMDTDQGRRDAVENGLGKPGLRAVRKQHKQYFWKRPRH